MSTRRRYDHEGKKNFLATVFISQLSGDTDFDVCTRCQNAVRWLYMSVSANGSMGKHMCEGWSDLEQYSHPDDVLCGLVVFVALFLCFSLSFFISTSDSRTFGRLGQ